jgi:DNA-directed RNA polymerase subunit RPC12/RpoP
MDINKYKHEYCMECGKDHSDKLSEEVCECGSRNFIYGDSLVKTDKGYDCGCNNPMLEVKLRVCGSPLSNVTYVCKNCGAQIGQQIYYENPYLAY